MVDIQGSLECDPQGDHVSKKRVGRFSEELIEGEKAHFVLSLNWMERNGEKKNPSRQSLALFTNIRVLTLIRPLTGSNELNEISYDDIEGAELKTGLSAKKVILESGSGKVVFKVSNPGKSECKDTVQFVNNIISGEEHAENISDQSKSFGDYSPVGDYVTEARISKLEDVLDADENVHYLTRGTTVDVEGSSAGKSLFGDDRSRKSGTKGYVRAAYTQKRVVIKIPQWMGSDERTIPYRNITSVDLDTGLVNKRVSLQTAGQTYHIETQEPGKSECREIVKFVRDKIRDSQTSSNQTEKNEEDPLDQLDKLKDLHEKGAISDEEFEEKKEDLLDKI
jgi:hypothetical protein